MAILKVKKVKGHEYFYWRKSIRSRKKFGGDGRVKTVDHLIGPTPVGQWLPYRFWCREAELQEYAEATIKHLCPAAWTVLIETSIDWRRRKISIKSKFNWFADCRSRRWREERKALQSWLDRIIEDSTQIDRLIQHAGYITFEELKQVVEKAGNLN